MFLHGFSDTCIRWVKRQMPAACIFRHPSAKMQNGPESTYETPTDLSPRARPWAAGLKSTSVKKCSLQRSASKHRTWQTQRANGRRPPRTRPWPSPMANANVFRIAAPNGIMLPKRRGAKRWGAGLELGGGELRDRDVEGAGLKFGKGGTRMATKPRD